MVLWENVSRSLPFAHIRFNSQVEIEVMKGARPVMPATLSSAAYAKLVESCWHQDAWKRPSMDEVQRQLELLNVTSTTAHHETSGQSTF